MKMDNLMEEHARQKFHQAGFRRHFSKQYLGRRYTDSSLNSATAAQTREERQERKNAEALAKQAAKVEQQASELDLAKRKLSRQRQRHVARILKHRQWACGVIQRNWKHSMRRRRFQVLRSFIQSWTRRQLAPVWHQFQSQIEDGYAQIQSACIIQQRWRKRWHHQHQSQAATTIQCQWKGAQTRAWVHLLRLDIQNDRRRWRASISIQTWFRGILVRMILNDLQERFIPLQRSFRAKKQRLGQPMPSHEDMPLRIDPPAHHRPMAENLPSVETRHVAKPKPLNDKQGSICTTLPEIHHSVKKAEPNVGTSRRQEIAAIKKRRKLQQEIQAQLAYQQECETHERKAMAKEERRMKLLRRQHRQLRHLRKTTTKKKDEADQQIREQRHMNHEDQLSQRRMTLERYERHKKRQSALEAAQRLSAKRQQQECAEMAREDRLIRLLRRLQISRQRREKHQRQQSTIVPVKVPEPVVHKVKKKKKQKKIKRKKTRTSVEDSRMEDERELDEFDDLVPEDQLMLMCPEIEDTTLDLLQL